MIERKKNNYKRGRQGLRKVCQNRKTSSTEQNEEERAKKDGVEEEVKRKGWGRGGFEKGQCSRKDKKGDEEEKNTAENTEREAKGDLNHNPLLNFTRSRSNKDPRAGHRLTPLTGLGLCCVYFMCVCHREVESRGGTLSKLHVIY